jgi:hypothetical protein
MLTPEIQKEINRLVEKFEGADENKINAMAAMIEQAAYERIYLKRLNSLAIETGLVQFHPENTMLQRTLPVSNEIAKHSAALTNILDKLCRNLCVGQEEDDGDLDEYN